MISGKLNLNQYEVSTNESRWKCFLENHGLYTLVSSLDNILFVDNSLVIEEELDSYTAAILSDFLRYELLKTSKTFSFETVFSHPSKLSFMKEANQQGYKCYLYFMGVSSPQICVDRVLQRTLEGGHGVPEEKIRKRYDLALNNLFEAIYLSHRSYVFDNSLKDMNLVAEVNPQQKLTLVREHIPVWFKESILDKL